MALQWIVNLIQFVSWLPWAVSMNTIFKLWLTNIRSIKNMKVVTSHPQNSLAGESLGVLGHCRLLILLNWLDTKCQHFGMKMFKTKWLISIYLPYSTHANTHWHKQWKQMKMLWPPGCLPVHCHSHYQPLIQEDWKEHWHISIASVPNLKF